MTYYNVGKLIVDAQGGKDKSKYGDKLIKEYSKKLTDELGKGYSTTTLKYMRQFYLFQIGQPVVDQLSWSHYTILMSLKNEDEINYYISQVKRYNLSRRELLQKIKLKEYERLDDKSKEKLTNKKEYNYEIDDFIKHPVVIKNKLNIEDVSEKILKQLILEDIDEFLLQLGQGFAYIGNEYKIKMGDRYNYIDLLLYNIMFNCYVVVELKVTELKAEHIGQIKKYMNYVDKNIKTDFQNKTIGIIICKKDNKYVIEYSSDERIYRTPFIVSENKVIYNQQ